VAERCLEMGVSYAKQRVTFGNRWLSGKRFNGSWQTLLSSFMLPIDGVPGGLEGRPR